MHSSLANSWAACAALASLTAGIVGCGSGSDLSATATGGSSAAGASSITDGGSPSSSSSGGSSNATGGTVTLGGSPSTNLPKLTVVGNKLQDPSGKTIVLRGSSLIDIGAIYAYGGKTATAVSSKIDKILAAGVQGHVVRMPVYPKIDYNGGDPYCSPMPYPVGTGPSTSCTPTTALNASDYYTKVLKPAVDYATSKNLYVIIDHHQIDNMTSSGSTASPSATDAKTFWADIAPKFANYPNVLYEIYNEPIDSSKSWSSIKPVVQDIITTVRSAGAENVIIVPSNSWDQKPGDAASDPPAGGNLMFTAHIYANNWSSGFQSQVTTAVGKAPVFISEWGYSTSDANYQTFGTNLQTTIEGNGASWTAWVTDNSWWPNMFTDAALTQLSPFGSQVKTWLSNKAASDWVE